MFSAAISRDVRFAVRIMRKSPGFAGLVILSLGLGIGATTAIFTTVNGLLYKSLPIKDPESLVQVTKISRGPTLNNFSYPAFRIIKDIDNGLTGAFAWHRMNVRVEQHGSTELIAGAFVSGEFYDTLGIRPALGRLLGVRDDQVSASTGGPVATISYAYWQRAFGGDPGVTTRTLTVDGIPVAIVGVQPQGFHGLEVGATADITLPVAAEKLLRGRGSMLDVLDANWLKVFARVSPGANEAAIKTRLRLVSPRLFQQVQPGAMTADERQEFLAQQLDLAPAGKGLSDLRQQFMTPLSIMLAIVVMVMAIACANIATLLLARATARRGEIAVRFAMGASRGDVIRSLFIEGLMFSVLGGVLGFILSLWGRLALLKLIAPSLGGLVLDVSIDHRILAFTAALSLVSSVIFSLMSGLAVGQVDVANALRQTAANVRGASGGLINLRHALVVCQVAVSLLLLVVAASFVQSLRNLRTANLGFDADNLLIVGTTAANDNVDSAKLKSFYTNFIERLNTTPGVRLATAARFGPFEGGGFTLRANLLGAPDSRGEEVHVNAVGPKFFEVVGIPILRGRGLDLHDIAQQPRVAVINEALARQFFPNDNPVGKYIALGVSGQPVEIVGVAEDVRYDGPRNNTPRTVFTAWSQDPQAVRGLTLLVRGADSTGTAAAAVRREIASASSLLTLSSVVNLRDRVEMTLGQDRLLAVLSSGFAWLAVILAAVGLYGVIAYSVSRRTAEIGLRMALGAQGKEIVWLLLRETFWLMLIGIGIGVPAAIATMRAVASLLFGTGEQSPLIIGVAVLVMLTAAAAGAFVPARNACRVDPLLALRAE